MIPFLDRMNATPDAWALKEAGGGIYNPRWWSDRYRGDSAPDGPGLSPELRALMVEPMILGERDRRWLLDSRPGPEDAELLLDVLERLEETSGQEAEYDRQAVLLTLGLLKDSKTEAALRKFAEFELQAVAALARRGDVEALGELVTDAGRDVQALALLLTVQPERGREVLLGQLEKGDLDAPCFDLGGPLTRFEPARAWMKRPRRSWSGVRRRPKTGDFRRKP